MGGGKRVNIKAAVIGGMNFDVVGISESALMMRDSNIGKIRFSAGGVGRNIAEQLARLGAQTTLFTCVSNDFAGNMLKNDAKIKNIDLSFAKESASAASVYVSIHEPGGDMALAINDMGVIDEISPEYLEKVLPEIRKADVVVVDANLSPESLRFIFQNVDCAIVADPVSCAKIDRLKPYLGRLAAFKPNALEAMYLTGAENARLAASMLVRMGVKRVAVSMGDAGCVYADEKEIGGIMPDKVYACQTNGAGDAMCAGLTLGAALGESAKEAAERGMRAAEKLLSEREEAEKAVNGNESTGGR